MRMVIDHIGVVVPALQHGIEHWASLFGYAQHSPIVTNTRQKVKVVFLAKAGSTTVKLIEPIDASSPVYALARKGGGLHHICFRCASLQTQIPELQTKGARLLVPAQPGEAFRNHNIAFLFGANNLNFELIDTSEKEGWMG